MADSTGSIPCFFFFCAEGFIIQNHRATGTGAGTQRDSTKNTRPDDTQTHAPHQHTQHRANGQARDTQDPSRLGLVPLPHNTVITDSVPRPLCVTLHGNMVQRIETPSRTGSAKMQRTGPTRSIFRQAILCVWLSAVCCLPTTGAIRTCPGLHLQ